MGKRLLVLADLHHVAKARHAPPAGPRQCRLGLELARRAIARALRWERPDAIVVLGDLLDDGRAPGAEEDLTELAEALRRPGIPVIVTPGNHDGPAERVLAAFGQDDDVHELGHWLLVTFTDRYGEDDRAARDARGLERLRAVREAHPGRPIVALQHSPVHPPIESAYPYNLTNAAQVMRAYRECGVTLSLSGHYHPGLAACEADGVRYAVAPALCEAPFRSWIVTLDDDGTKIHEQRLSFEPSAELVDVHCHTDFSYCSHDRYSGAEAVARCRMLGLTKVYLTDHAGQLYVEPDDFWSARFQWDPGLLRAAREQGRDRVAHWKAALTPLRGADVGVGLEMECHPDGSLTVLPEDLAGVDIRLGAVHWLPCIFAGETTPARLRAEFLEQTEGLVRAGVDVLAHPFRIFARNRCAQPEGVEEAVLDLLAETGVAAEINYHQNVPTREFFARCLERGIPIVFGTDAHTPEEIGELAPHRALLRAAEVLAGR